MFETTRPIQKRRKSRCSSADHAEVRPGSAAVASSRPSVSSSGARSSAVICESAWESNPPRNVYAPSTVLKTEGLTGAPALSGEFPMKLRRQSLSARLARRSADATLCVQPPRRAQHREGVDRDPLVHPLAARPAPVHVVGARHHRFWTHPVVALLGRPAPVG